MYIIQLIWVVDKAVKKGQPFARRDSNLYPGLFAQHHLTRSFDSVLLCERPCYRRFARVLQRNSRELSTFERYSQEVIHTRLAFALILLPSGQRLYPSTGIAFQFHIFVVSLPALAAIPNGAATQTCANLWCFHVSNTGQRMMSIEYFRRVVTQKL